jgi:flavin reductase (DIM6/NTAB) family NADH-FMN oxidoreductase RutF
MGEIVIVRPAASEPKRPRAACLRERSPRDAGEQTGTAMFYETADNKHGLKYDPFKAIVAPRPIGWISTLSAGGVPNLAPYSFFNAVSHAPPMVMFTSGGRKDSIRNIEATGEFVCNLATLELSEQMNKSSAEVGPEVDEFELAGLTAAPCRLVKAPRVAESPAALECKLLRIEELKDLNGTPVDRHMALGQVVGVHIDDRYVHDGMLDATELQSLARLGYMDYSAVDKVFEILRPQV